MYMYVCLTTAVFQYIPTYSEIEMQGSFNRKDGYPSSDKIEAYVL